MHVQWGSYVYWRGAPFKGIYTNIDEQGLRKTWSAPENENSLVKKRMKMFMFGGSTLWRTGGRDDETIPSFLAQMLAREWGINANVVNFGSGGYVTTQEVIALLRELQQGNIPDLVVFYDGVNDTFTALQNRGVAGLPQNEANREREFNLLRPDNIKRLYKETLLVSFTNSATYQVLVALIRRITGYDLFGSSPPFPSSPSQAGYEVARIYNWNVTFVKKLGEIYGFPTLFYWQPAIYNKDAPTAYERRVLQSNTELARYYKAATKEVNVGLSGLAGFHDISDVFTGDRKPYFIDAVHITGAGNAIIARRIVKDVAPIIQKSISTKQ
jgi:lysophospholipase L1-like esterase